MSRTRGASDKAKRKMHPKSLAAVAPHKIKPGEVRNPLGINRGRTYSDRYEEMALAVFPEKMRLKINETVGEEILKKGATWAQANALRRHIGAVIEGNTMDAKEVREAVEGKATQRMEVTGAEGRDLIPAGSARDLTDEELDKRLDFILRERERMKAVQS